MCICSKYIYIISIRALLTYKASFCHSHALIMGIFCKNVSESGKNKCYAKQNFIILCDNFTNQGKYNFILTKVKALSCAPKK